MPKRHHCTDTKERRREETLVLRRPMALSFEQQADAGWIFDRIRFREKGSKKPRLGVVITPAGHLGNGRPFTFRCDCLRLQRSDRRYRADRAAAAGYRYALGVTSLKCYRTVAIFALPRQTPHTGRVPVFFSYTSIPQKKVDSKWFFCE